MYTLPVVSLPVVSLLVVVVYLFTAQFDIEGGSPRWGAKCIYDFQSNKLTRGGRFFSPRFPQHYPPDVTCQYLFFGMRHERVKIVFQNIQLEFIDGR